MKIKLIPMSLVATFLMIGCTNESPMSAKQNPTEKESASTSAVIKTSENGKIIFEKKVNGSKANDKVASTFSENGILLKRDDNDDSDGSNGEYIGDIMITASEKNSRIQCIDPGFERLSVDLNDGAGGDWIYLCYKKVTDLHQVVMNTIVTELISSSKDQLNYIPDDDDLPVGVSMVHWKLNEWTGANTNFDLNRNTNKHNEYISMWKYATNHVAYRGLAIISSGSSYFNSDLVEKYQDDGWDVINKDLNQGASGNWIYLATRRD